MARYYSPTSRAPVDPALLDALYDEHLRGVQAAGGGGGGQRQAQASRRVTAPGGTGSTNITPR